MKQPRSVEIGIPLSNARHQMLLQLVKDGDGKITTRGIDIQISAHLDACDLTVLEELRVLEREGKVLRIVDTLGEERGWQITEAGSATLIHRSRKK